MQDIEPVWKGILTGLLFTLTFGTVFFSLIQTSVKRGISKALAIAIGVLMSDAFFISVTVLGIGFVTTEMHKYDVQIRIIGFAFLVFIGVRSIFKKEVDHTDDIAPTERNASLYVLKGIMLNSINPMLLISWMGAYTYIKSTTQFNGNQILFYFIIVLCTMFATMFGIVYSAGKLKNVLSAKNLNRLNILSGIIFIIFAFAIIWPVANKYFINPVMK
ncbi:MAG: LysE family transporter [Bacteroidia bacterium]|nr:LysE family transporter [Bacteroidia bacterium]MCC7532948.1 LysE family transporter [Bacteroidia bacterium]